MNNRHAETANPLRDEKTSGPPTGTEIRPTICSICNPGSHCGVDAYVKNGRIIKVKGSMEAHNAGTLCAKGAAGRQYVYHSDRLTTPLIRTGERGTGRFEPTSWKDALSLISNRLNEIKTETGPESVIFYAGYPKWMRPFLKRLAHSFGSPNYASESSTCHTAVKLAAILNYGEDASPEVGRAKCLLVWSRNPFYSNPPRSRGLLAARKKGLKIIEVGPLVTPLTHYADIHLRIRPGTSGALALALAHVIIKDGIYDRDFVNRWTLGFDEYRNLAHGFAPDAAEKITDVPAELIVRAARLFAGSKPAAVMTGASPTVHHTNGLQNQRAINTLVGLTGNFDVPGGNHVFPSNYLYISNGVKTRDGEYMQSCPWSEMAPRVGEDKHPVWCRFTPEAHSMMVPFQIRSQKPYPIRAMLAFGLNHRMWPGSDFAWESFKSRAYRIPRLRRLQPDPMADLNPADARKRDLSQGDWVLLSTGRGAIRVRANLTETVPPGVVNMYHGRPEADVNTLIDPDYRDPISGFPAFKSLLCEVKKAPD